MSLSREILNTLHSKDPYKDFDYQNYPVDIQGWNSEDDVVEQLVRMSTPQLIIEIGSWKGASAIHLSKILKRLGYDAAVICIDTWLGSLEHYLRDHPEEHKIEQWYHHGYPTLYYQFLANVMHSECQDYIVPFPATSSMAAKWFMHQRIQSSLIYIDGSHDEDDIYRDMNDFWPVLATRGLMYGDDWQIEWPGLIYAVKRFVREKDVMLEIIGKKWIIPKQLTIAVDTQSV